MSVYAAVPDVAGITQQENGYTATSIPTTAQVQSFLDQCEAEMEVQLNNVGYVVPVAAAAAPYTATRALLVLKKISSLMAAAMAIEQLDQGAGRKDSRAEEWRAGAESMLNDIASGSLKLFDALPTSLVEDYPYQLMRSGNLEGEANDGSELGGPSVDGVTKQAYMTRAQVF